MTKTKKRKRFRGVRIPARLDEMIIDIQRLLSTDYTGALKWILVDWEKFRYLTEKERLLRLAKLRFQLIKQEAKRTKTLK